MEELETREMRYFVAVAEELHFGAAAERLGIAQPPLSRAISRLERRLGVTLFRRTTRRVTLTPAGEVFLPDCRTALAASAAAVTRARRAARPGLLTLAMRPGAAPGVLTALLDAYARRPDAVPTEVVFTYDEPGALRDGSADAALMCATQDTADLALLDIGPEKPVALLPAHHALADESALSLGQLGALDGFAAELPHEALDVIVDRVALGRLVVVVGESVLGRLGNSVAAVPVTDYPTTRLVLAWPPAVPHPARAGLVETARHAPLGK